MNYNYPHSHQECPTCLRLREENARLKAMLHVSRPELWDKIERLTRERDEARAEVARLDGKLLEWESLATTTLSRQRG